MNTQPSPLLVAGSFIRPRQLCPAILPIGISTLWRWVSDGKFPAPVRFNSAISAFRCDDVIAWIAAQK